MALVTSRADLNQGQSNSVAACVYATGTGADIRIHTGAANNLPALAADEYFEVRDHTNTQNNGLFRVVTVNTSTDDYECNKMFGSAPIVAASETVTTLGATGASLEKSVFIDTTTPGIAFLEQGNVDAAGVTGTAVYSFLMQEYKDDDFLLATAKFPMRAIDNDAGKYIIGQDVNGVNSGFTWLENTGEAIRTRKVLRNMGWNEIDANGNIIKRYHGVLSVDAVEDPANDTGFYQFGTDNAVDDTVDLTFAGPANEAVEFFNEIGNPPTCNFLTSSTITRASGSFVTDGYKVGGQVTVRNADAPANDGTFVLTAVAALTLTVTGTPFTTGADTNAILAVNNDNAFRLGLRVRDGDTNGKTYAESSMAAIGKAALGNFVFQFPMANATDLKITATDATITGSSPWNGMTITFHATPQARGGLVGGPYNFGIIVAGNTGTNVQCFEFMQWALRQLTDQDSGGGIAIGRSIGLLARFNGDVLEVGSGDGALTFPINPQGGGSGVFIDNLNAASDNSTVFYDNLNAEVAKPESITITHDFNQVAIDDVATISKAYFDRTIRTNLTDFVLATTGGGRITSATSALPNNAELSSGSYVRISGLTGGDAAMNGVYQITTETTPGDQWEVIRYDGTTIVAVAAATVDIDQNCIDTPDNIIVHTNIGVTATDIDFTAPDTIGSVAAEFAVFAAGDFIEVIGTPTNDGIYEIDTVVAATITTIEQTLLTQAAGSSYTIQKVYVYTADADQSDNFAFDDNVQGGRTVSTTAYIKSKAIGAGGAQYLESSVTSIVSGTPVTIPLFTPGDLNYV